MLGNVPLIMDSTEKQHAVEENPFSDNFRAQSEETSFRKLTIGIRARATGICSDGELVFVSESARASGNMKPRSRARVKWMGGVRKTLPEYWTTGENNLEFLSCCR